MNVNHNGSNIASESGYSELGTILVKGFDKKYLEMVANNHISEQQLKIVAVRDPTGYAPISRNIVFMLPDDNKGIRTRSGKVSFPRGENSQKSSGGKGYHKRPEGAMYVGFPRFERHAYNTTYEPVFLDKKLQVLGDELGGLDKKLE